MDPSLEKTAEHAKIQSDLSVMSVSVGAWENSRETIPRWNGQRDLAGAAAEGKQLQLATSAMIIACHMFAPPDPGNGSGDCPLFCKLCRTEVNEKTTKPRTFSPGNRIESRTIWYMADGPLRVKRTTILRASPLCPASRASRILYLSKI